MCLAHILELKMKRTLTLEEVYIMPDTKYNSISGTTKTDHIILSESDFIRDIYI